MAAIIMMAAIGAWAIGTHRISYVVTYGISMHPIYHAGDLVVVVRAESYEVGQIAAYHVSGGQVEVLHRIVGGDPRSGFVLKGDNNASSDPLTPTADELIGRAFLLIPNGGIWLQPLLSPTGLGMLGFLLVSGGAAAAKTRRDIPRGRRKKKAKNMASQGGGSLAVATATFKAVSRLHPALRVLAVITALCGIAGFALGVLGFLKPATETVPGTGKAGESMTFSYSAEVPRSAAYDDTTVYAPDPVFRRLANLVTVRMNYTGEPGRMQVNAQLAAQNGWHTSLQLSQEEQFTSNTYTDTVQLDLPALEQRALDAGKAIGADMGAVSLTVTAEVKHGDGTSFAPQLSLDLAPLALTLTGGADALTVDRSSDSGVTSIRERQISAFGHDLLTAAEARRYAVLLLLAAIVGAIVVAMIALRHVPLRTRAQIERRYPHLLVPVEPMASPPGKPVVLVDTFPALVKLAERYGQMILTWTRPDGVDDFVVRDEGITYRYRITPSTAEPPAPSITAEPPTPTDPPSRTSPAVSASTPAAALPAAPETAENKDPEIAKIKEPELSQDTDATSKEADPQPAEPGSDGPDPDASGKAPTSTLDPRSATEEAEPQQPEPPRLTTPAPAVPETEATVPPPAETPAKRARRPKPKVEPSASDPAQPPTEPKKRTPRPRKQSPTEPGSTKRPSPRKATSARLPKTTPQPESDQADSPTADEVTVTEAEVERQAVEDLAARNESITSAEDGNQPAIYDFLPPAKRRD